MGVICLSNSKVRSLSVSGDWYDRQQIIRQWLAKQNHFIIC